MNARGGFACANGATKKQSLPLLGFACAHGATKVHPLPFLTCVQCWSCAFVRRVGPKKVQFAACADLCVLHYKCGYALL